MKALICFTFDDGFMWYLNHLVHHMEKIEGVKRSDKSGLPFHITIWGGLEMNCLTWEERLRKVVVMLRPFHGELPVVRELSPYHLAGRHYGLSVNFEQDSFVMAGNRSLNLSLLRSVGGEGFEIDQPRHITLVKIEETLKRKNVDEFEVARKLRECIKSLPTHNKEIKLTPKVFIKSPTWDKWREMDLSFLGWYGIDWRTGGFHVCEVVNH